MADAEFSMIVPLDRLLTTPTVYALEAGAEARAALSARLDLLALDRLSARLEVRRVGRGVVVEGEFEADVVQECVVSSLPVPAYLRAPVKLQFESLEETAGEIELEADELDIMPLEDGAIDLGEAVVQSLALALDPYPRAGDAELAEARAHLMSEEAAAAQELADRMARSPFARLKQ